VLNRHDVFLNTRADVKLLPKILDAAVRFKAGDHNLKTEEETDSWWMEPIFKGRDLIL